MDRRSVVVRSLCYMLVLFFSIAGCCKGSSSPAVAPPSAGANGDTSSTADLTPATASTGPTASSVTAATATAQNNSLCTAIRPFYWEIGDQNSALVSDSLGTDSNGNRVLATTNFSIASSSKMIYGTYVVQLRGSAANLTSQDVNFLHFTSGYTNMGDSTTGGQCPSTDTPDTVNTCLALLNPANALPYSYQDPRTIGKFDYDSGHLENHASQYGGLGNIAVGMLGPTVGNLLGSNTPITYTEPLLAGGIYASSNDYAEVLRNILSGSLFMRDALGRDPVCTLPSAPGCNAIRSPIPEAWHYSIAHWVEDDPSTHGDGAFSSAGAFGFYPWINAAKTYYGVISRENEQGAGGYGYDSAQCGRLIRRAWDTGMEQTGQIPTASSSPALSTNGVTNAASNLGGPVAPGEIVVLYGSGLGPAQIAQLYLDSTGNVGTQLADTIVSFNGTPAPIVYTSATQVAAIVPYQVSGTSAQITVTYLGQTSTPVAETLSSSVPALFTADSTGRGQAAAVNQDGSYNGASHPAETGSIVLLYATGEGQTSPVGADGKPAQAPLPYPLLPVTVTIGGQTAIPQYAGGAPGEVAGVMQINVQIPSGITPGDAVPVTIQVGNATSQSGVTIAVARN